MNSMKKQTLCVLAAMICAAQQANANHPDSVYIATYANNPKAGLHVAYSSDNSRWIGIGDNYDFVKSDFGAWGSQKQMFAPSVLKHNGVWYAVWGVNTDKRQFAATKSSDLWLWKPQDYPYMDVSEVLEPVLSREGDEFVVMFKTADGSVYKTVSCDFSHWSKAVKVDNSDYFSQKQSISVGGARVEADVNRVPWQFVNSLITNVDAASQRYARECERMTDDASRFAKVSEIKAFLKPDANNSKAISNNLIGIFFEDINYAADGGLYAELIQNRDFEYSEGDNRREKWNAKTSWTLEGDGTEWSIVTDNPLHANNSHSSLLKTDKVGARLVNGGFDGIVVKKGEKYDLSLFFRSKDAQKVRISLREGDKTLASTVVSLKSGALWKQYGAVLVPSASAEKAVLAIEPMQKGELQLDFVSLFPQKTFKNRKNGMRADIAQLLADMKPRFVRFPGGCASHGNGIENIYHWKHSVGKPWERKGDFNIWNYHQSRGLGFFEYFQFCEDIGAEPLPVLSAGVPCQNSSRGGRDGKNDGQQGGLSMDEMKDYLQELLDLIEWANGDAKKSKLAAMRAEVGHPKPFNLKYLGIGNEDLISDVFVERYNYLCREIRKAHPEITVVGTVGPFWEGSDYEEGWKIAKQEKLDIVDEHYYNQPGWYLNNQNFYDKYDRNGTKVYLGEWASKGNKLENALVEALHLTNVERNADVVVMSSYAPLLAKEGHTQWNPDLIYFNNSEVKPTANYYVQALFGQNSGDEYIPADVDLRFKTDRSNRVSRSDVMRRIGTSVVRDSKTGDVFVKLVNCLPEDVNLTIDLNDIIKIETIKSGKNKTAGASNYYLDADYTVLTGNIAEGNQKPTSGTAKVHSESDDFSLEYTMPKYSFTVIKLAKRK